VAPIAPQQFFTELTTDGNLIPGNVSALDVIPGEQIVGDADQPITNDGTISAVKLAVPSPTPGSLTGTRIYTLPNATTYISGHEIVFYDTTGNPNNQIARVRAGQSLVDGFDNKVNGGLSVDINDGPNTFFRRVFTADPLTANWNVNTVPFSSAPSLSIMPWQGVSVVGGTVTLLCDPNKIEQHHIVALTSNATLVMGGSVQNGMTGRVKFRQGSGGQLITLPTGSKTPSNGQGVLTLSSTASAEDEFIWDYDGTAFNFYPAGLRFSAAPPPTFVTLDVDTLSTGTTSGYSTLGGNGVNPNNFKFGAAGKLVTSGTISDPQYQIGKITLLLSRFGAATLTYNIKARILGDASGAPNTSAQVGGASQAVAAQSLTGTDTAIDFNLSTPATVSSGSTYWVVLFVDDYTNYTTSTTDYVQWAGKTITGVPAFRSADGVTWFNIAPNRQLKYKTWK
jgi:hypothetical protein